MSHSSPIRQDRIPFFAKVEAPLGAPAGPMYAWNISRGGLYLKVSGGTSDELPVGSDVPLAFALPDGGPRVKLAAEVVWVDPAVRDHRGERALGLGMRFVSVDNQAGARIRGFIESFRYRVVLFGFDSHLAEHALSDLFGLEPETDLDTLRRGSVNAHTGLVLIGERLGREVAREALEAVLDFAPDDEGVRVREPPIIYCADSAGEWLETLVERHARLSYAATPMERVTLRSQARRAVETFVLGFQNELLSDELERAIERLRRENEYLRDHAGGEMHRFEGIIGESAAMRRVFMLIDRVAPLKTSVMITGETGSGKELVVRAIHAKSTRHDRAFLAQNCAALSETLLDNELFGHARGAYTGATADHPGLFEAADGGTVFLDEIGEMPPSMQAKLLRVLETGEVRRIGETRTRRVDVRVLCATHRDLDAMVEDGSFRGDLLYRLRSFIIPLPPLRERREDIPLLALHFLERWAVIHGLPRRGLTVEAMSLLEGYSWPGNVRELEHAMERLFVLAGDGGKIEAAAVREALGAPALPVVQRDKGQTLDTLLNDYERSLILAQLKRSRGVIARAARALGLDRSTLSRRLRRLGISPESA